MKWPMFIADNGLPVELVDEAGGPKFPWETVTLEVVAERDTWHCEPWDPLLNSGPPCAELVRAALGALDPDARAAAERYLARERDHDRIEAERRGGGAHELVEGGEDADLPDIPEGCAF